MRTGFDIANPSSPIPGFDVAAFYLGGDAAHVWTEEQIHTQPARWRWPIWVMAAGGDGRQHGLECVLALCALGVPKHTAVMLDCEAISEPHRVDAFADVVHQAGWITTPYGSTSTLFTNPVRAGYAVATLDGNPVMYSHPHVIGTQWGQETVGPAPGQKIDQWLIVDQLPLWDAHPAPAPLPGWAAASVKDLQAMETAASAVITLIRANAR